jgi:hypothetical protein
MAALYSVSVGVWPCAGHHISFRAPGLEMVPFPSRGAPWGPLPLFHTGFRQLASKHGGAPLPLLLSPDIGLLILFQKGEWNLMPFSQSNLPG